MVQTPAEFENQRRYPRVRPFRPVKLILADGSEVADAVFDISPDGMQLRCKGADARRIYPSGQPITAGNRPELELIVCLPFVDGDRRASVRCRLCYIHATKDGSISFGCQFLHLDVDSQQVLYQFFGESMEPAT